MIIDDIDRFVGNTKATKVKAPRVVKAKPVAKIVEKLKHKKSDPDLRIVSINPQDIVGATQLLTLNTKDRRLTVYYAQGPAGLGVKGTTITGFDPDTSIGKRLRKPELVIKDLLGAGKVAIKKIMPDLKTSPAVPNGRTNEEVVLLRVMR